MAAIKQATAYTRVFTMLDVLDHLTPLAGETVTVTLSKAGAAFAAPAGAVSAISGGFYKIALTAADTATLGDLALHCTSANADPTNIVDQVYADPAALANLDAAVTTRATTAAVVSGVSSLLAALPPPPQN